MISTRQIIAESVLPQHEAVRLLSVASGLTRTEILVGSVVDDAVVRSYRRLERRRVGHTPLQYLEGSIEFGGATLDIDDRVLVPRPETEELLEIAIGLVSRPRVIVDLCTGSGNLAVALGLAFPDASVYATDISADAVDVATANAVSNGANVTVLHGDLFTPLPRSLMGTVDLIVANPPYLADSEFGHLPLDVQREPRRALVSGVRGDEILTSIAAEAADWLRPGAPIVCEISEFHGARIKHLFASYDATVEVDLSGRDRFVIGRRRVE